MAELTRLGRYQLKQVLGRGAMGVVYEGLDPSLNRRVAVKTILKNAAIDAETARGYSAQFAREAQAAGRLNHPHIVQVHDFAEEGDVAYLVMEYIQGRELRSFFEAKEKFDVAETVRIMGELLDALEFAHEAGVIHRDVKPANVMLDAQRRVKLADFGVARIQDSERSAAGTMVGTPAFMSPEQIQGLKIDRRTDIFSAGTILYQLLTGDQPFTGQGAWTVAKKIMEDHPPQPSSVVKSVSPAFDAIVDRALAKKASDRYASAREFAAALRSTVAPAQLSVPPATPAIPAPKSRAAPQASETELEFWRAIQNSTDAEEFEFYLEQFPEGTYAGLARHKMARLRSAAAPDPQASVRLEVEAQERIRQAEEMAAVEAAEKARREEAERAQREAQENARREAEEAARRAAVEKAAAERVAAERVAAEKAAAEKARLAAEERVRREAAERASRIAEERARYEAAEKAKREAAEKAKRAAEERARQAAVLARLKQQEAEAASAKVAVDADSTVALPPRSRESAPLAAPPPPATPKSIAVPAGIAALVIVGGIATYFGAGRTPTPAPVAEVAPAKPEAAPAPAADPEKIRRETEERLRKEFSEKAAAERAALEKSLAEKAAAEAAAAQKAAQAKGAVEKAAAAAVAARAAAEKVAAQKAAAEKAVAERAAAEQVAAQKAAAEKAAADKAVADKAAAEKVASDKVAAEKAAAEKAEMEKNVAAMRQREAKNAQRLEKFMGQQGRWKFFTSARAIGPLRTGEVAYVTDGMCPWGEIKQVIGGDSLRNTPRTVQCIPLPE